MTAKLKMDTMNFRQKDGESFYETRQRFKELVCRRPQHGLEKWKLVHTFYNGLGEETKAHLDASSGGVFMNQHADDAYDKLEMMAMNNFIFSKGREGSKKMAGVYELDQYTALNARMDSMSSKLDNLTIGVKRIFSDKFPWFPDLVNFLACNVLPSHQSSQQRKKCLAAVKHYVWEDPCLFKFCADQNQIIRRCAPEEQMTDTVYHFHSSEYSDHFGANKTAARVLQSGPFWPTLFKDANVSSCDKCQRLGNI